VLDPADAPPTVAAAIAPDGLLGRLAASRVWYDGRAELAPLAGSASPQILFARAFGGPPVAIVWLAEAVRERAVAHGDPTALAGAAAELDVEFSETPLARALFDGLRPAAATHAGRIETVAAAASGWADSGDLAALAALAGQARRAGLAVRIGWSDDLDVGYALVEARRGRAVTRAAWLVRPGPSCPPIAADATAVWHAISAGCARIVVVGDAP